MLTSNVVLLLQLASTLPMVGLIWFIQIVHYPLMELVGEDGFCRYEHMHKRRTTFVVAPLMVTEAVTAVMLLWLTPDSVPLAVPMAGVVLLALLWISTALWQVPMHNALSGEYDRLLVRRLVRSNWLRTICWSVRGLLVVWMVG